MNNKNKKPVAQQKRQNMNGAGKKVVKPAAKPVKRAVKPRLIMTRYYSCGSTCNPPVTPRPCGCSSAL